VINREVLPARSFASGNVFSWRWNAAESLLPSLTL